MNNETEQKGALYEAAQEEITGLDPRPEDQEASEQLLSEKLDLLVQEHGEVKGLLKFEDFLLDQVKENREKIEQLLEQRKI